MNQQEERFNVFNCIVTHLPAIGNTLILADFVDLSLYCTLYAVFASAINVLAVYAMKLINMKNN